MRSSVAVGSADRPRLFHLITQVWGESYVDSLTSVCLPALLSPGNIPALAAQFPVRFTVYTRRADRPAIAGAKSFRRVAEIVPVGFAMIDDDLERDKYAALTRIHQRVVERALAEQAGIVWLVPDAVWSDGSLAVAGRAAALGRRAVMQPAIRVRRSEVLPKLVHRLAGGQASFSGRELVRLALDHMHPYYRAFYWDALAFNENPANVYWRVGSEGLIARCFHLHPLMLFPAKAAPGFVSTFDDDLPLLTCPEYAAFHVVEDSDEAFHIDLTEGDWSAEMPKRAKPPTSAFLARWALQAANLHHRRLLEHPIRIHTGDCSARWDLVERRSDRVIARTKRLVALAGAVRAPVGLAFGLRPAALLEDPAAWIPATDNGSHMNRLLSHARRTAYLIACGWVFGRTVACMHLGINPWRHRPGYRGSRFNRWRASLKTLWYRTGDAWIARISTFWWRILFPQLFIRYERIWRAVRHGRRHVRRIVGDAYEGTKRRARRARKRSKRLPERAPQTIQAARSRLLLAARARVMRAARSPIIRAVGSMILRAAPSPIQRLSREALRAVRRTRKSRRLAQSASRDANQTAKQKRHSKNRDIRT